MALTEYLRRHWLNVCLSCNDTTRHPAGYYGSVEAAPTLNNDYELCHKDALAGNERAMRYMAKFMELRMKE